MKKILTTLLALSLTAMLAIPVSGMATTADTVKTDVQKVEDKAKEVGETIKDDAEKAGEAIKDEAEKVGDAIKEGATEAKDKTEGVLDSLHNSGKIRKELNADKLANVLLTISGIDVELEVAKDGTYAELDATVLGINATDVSYDLTVTETETGTEIEAFHKGKDIGINSVKLHIYVPADAIAALTVAMDDSDLEIDELTIGSITGTLTTQSKIETDDAVIASVEITATDSEIELDGAITAAVLNTTMGKIKVDSSIVPETLKITADGTNVTVKVPDTAEGFAVNYSLTEGTFTTAFASEVVEQKGSVTIGEGKGAFDIEVIKGTLKIDRH